MCLNPVTLRNGITVPCGKCEICASNNRAQWSIRLAIHASYCDRMPLFICLTYDNEHLRYRDKQNGNFYSQAEMEDCPELYKYASPSLCREDASRFLKEYKRLYHLKNEQFTYFGCGEYGDSFGRPHMHLLFFGDNDLYDLYFQDEQKAVKRLQDVWKKGFVSIGVAQWSGIHYVTKYILKEDLNEIEQLGLVKPFLIASKGLGTSFFNSELCRKWKNDLVWLKYNSKDIFNNLPDFTLDDPSTIDCAIDYLRLYVPSFKLFLDDGRCVYLPRALRKRLCGSVEHFKDNPVWLYQSLVNLRRSIQYYNDFGDYDETHDKESWRDKLENRISKINQRLAKRKFDNKYKRSKL